MESIISVGRLVAPACLAVVFALFPQATRSARAADAYEIHVLVALTGGAAFIGQNVQKNLQALEAVVNQADGIRGQQLQFAFHDVESSPQTAVQVASQLLASHPAVILVSGPVALCNATAPLMRKGPVLYCLSPAFHPLEPGSGFSATTSNVDNIAAVVRYYRLKGWTRIAVLTATDATGQEADKGIDHVFALPENSAVRIVERQHFNPTDMTVAAQIERIKSSGAQALVAWTTGAPTATVFKGMIQAGLDIPISPSTGNEDYAQLGQYVGFLPKQLLLPSALFPEHDGLLTLDPRVEKVQHAMYAILKEHGLKADNNTAAPWDPALIVVEAMRKLGPTASADQLRDYIVNLTDFAGINGIYDFKAYPERGLGPDDVTIVRYDSQAKSWVWMSKPGGVPLTP